MPSLQKAAFQLDERLERDTVLATVTGLCQLRVMKDGRWPWVMLVPQRNGMSEPFELTPLDQTLLTFETNMVASALKKVTGAKKINVAAIGNIVSQLHVHIVARSEGDPNWPGSIWGFGTSQPRSEADMQQFIKALSQAL